MAHPRKQIRAAVVAALLGNVMGVSSRVYATRMNPVQRDDMPAICVYTLDETSLELHQNRRLDRQVDVAIDIYVRATAAPDDDIDDIAEEIEALMNADPRLGLYPTVFDSYLAATNWTVSGEGEQGNIFCRMRYSVRYTTKP